jgi:hypothetical protein
MGWTIQASSRDGGQRFSSSAKRPDRFWGAPTPLLNVCGVHSTEGRGQSFRTYNLYVFMHYLHFMIWYLDLLSYFNL